MSDEPDLPGGGGKQRELLARLRAVVEAKDTEVRVLRAELSSAVERERRLELRLAELERRLGMDSSNSGTPSSKEPIGAKERRKAERKNRDVSERERRKDRKRGGQPGHPGAGLSRDRDPDEREAADPPAECSGCGAALAGAEAAGSKWAQVWDVRISRWVTEWLLPSLLCRCCGKLTTADAPPGAHPGTISYGAGINGAAVLLSGYGNVPSERAARLIGMLLGIGVSPGFVDRASARLDEKLQAAGFDDAMQAALADEPVLGAVPVGGMACSDALCQPVHRSRRYAGGALSGVLLPRVRRTQRRQRLGQAAPPRAADRRRHFRSTQRRERPGGCCWPATAL